MKKIIWTIIGILIVAMNVIVYGPVIAPNTTEKLLRHYYNVSDRHLTKLEYKDLDEFAYVLENSYHLSPTDINNVVYTIKEDNLEDWYYDYLYNASDNKYPYANMWLIYDLVLNDQYCYPLYKNTNHCSVSKEETKTKSIEFAGTGIINSSITGDKIYTSTRGDNLVEAIDYAYIAIQGPETEGYDNAISHLYSLYQTKGGNLGKSDFVVYFNMRYYNYQEDLKEIKDMNIEQLVYAYDEYSGVIDKVISYFL